MILERMVENQILIEQDDVCKDYSLPNRAIFFAFEKFCDFSPIEVC